MTEIEQIRELSRFYQVPVRFVKEKERAGYFDLRRMVIYIAKDYHDPVSVFFHELGHLYCVINGLWGFYHRPLRRSKNGVLFCTKSHARAVLRTGYRAEKWVDKWAKEEMSMWFPDKRYPNSYSHPAARIWLYKNHLITYSNYL